MSDFIQIPESFRQVYTWQTDIITAYDGTEQRIAVARTPRQKFSVRYLADNDLDIQFWKYELTFNTDSVLNYIPLWGEILELSTAITAGATSFECDFSFTDEALGQFMLLIHPDGTTVQKVQCDLGLRTDTATTLASGTVIADYPIGTWCVPIEAMALRNNAGYTEAVAASASIGITADLVLNLPVVGYGSAALQTHLDRPVLNKIPEYIGSNETFNQKLTRIDYGGKIEVVSGENNSHSNMAKKYLSRGPADRQWWKLFLTAIRGRQGSFYAPTYRHDTSLVSQPAQGASTIIVDEASQFVDGWEFLQGHQDLAIFTADGDMQIKRISTATTIDNGNGTHTIGLTTPLTNTPLGSTIKKISFLELVRLSSDEVVVDHNSTHMEVSFSTRTLTKEDPAAEDNPALPRLALNLGVIVGEEPDVIWPKFGTLPIIDSVGGLNFTQQVGSPNFDVEATGLWNGVNHTSMTALEITDASDKVSLDLGEDLDPGLDSWAMLFVFQTPTAAVANRHLMGTRDTSGNLTGWGSGILVTSNRAFSQADHGPTHVSNIVDNDIVDTNWHYMLIVCNRTTNTFHQYTEQGEDVASIAGYGSFTGIGELTIGDGGGAGLAMVDSKFAYGAYWRGLKAENLGAVQGQAFWQPQIDNPV